MHQNLGKVHQSHTLQNLTTFQGIQIDEVGGPDPSPHLHDGERRLTDPQEERQYGGSSNGESRWLRGLHTGGGHRTCVAGWSQEGQHEARQDFCLGHLGGLPAELCRCCISPSNHSSMVPRKCPGAGINGRWTYFPTWVGDDCVSARRCS